MSRFEPTDAVRLREELQEEFAHHVEMIERAEIARGASPDAAREMALRRFGDQELAAGECARIVLGGRRIMNEALKAARLVLVSFWRVGVALALGLCVMLSWNANKRAIEALNVAGAAAARTGVGVGAVPGGGFDRAAMLASVWGPTSGEIEVRGAVKSPGRFHTDTRAPLDLAALIERAGGATGQSQMVLWRQRGDLGEAYVSLADALKTRGDFNLMPAPGSIITVK